MSMLRMKLSSRFGIVGEFMALLWQRKLWWIMPMVAILLAFAILLVFAQGSALAPFIYSIF